MTVYDRTATVMRDRLFSTHSSHLEYLQADIVGIACVVRKLTWTFEITTAVN